MASTAYDRSGWTATSTGYFDVHEESRAIDGDTGTFFHTANTELKIYLQIDVGEEIIVDEMKLDCDNQQNNCYAICESSPDGVTWSQRGDETYLARGTIVSITFDAIEARYWRLRLTKQTEYMVINELDLWGDAAAGLPATNITSVLPIGITQDASGEFAAGSEMENVFNNTFDSTWHSLLNTTGRWLSFDLGSATEINFVTITAGTTQNGNTVTLESSENNSDWTLRATEALLATDEYVILTPASPVTARYWRLITTTVGYANWDKVNLYETITNPSSGGGQINRVPFPGRMLRSG